MNMCMQVNDYSINEKKQHKKFRQALILFYS